MRKTTRMSHRPRRRATRTLAVGLTATLAAGLMAACSSEDDGGSGDGGSGSGEPEDVTVTVGVFGEFGFEEAGLYDQYMEENPHVTIQQDSVQENRDYVSQLLTRLSQGSGVADIQAIEVGNIYEMANELGDRWVDFNQEDVDLGHFLPWKVDQATNMDGRTIGLGTDIGPMAICYRKDLFEEAGLPSERTEVGELWAGDWAKYLDTGDEFLANTPGDAKYLDSAGGMFNAVVSGFGERYYDGNGELVYQDSEGVQTAWDLSVRVAENEMSAAQDQFSEEWDRSFSNGDFATISCPAWMLGYIQDKAGPDAENQWDVARAPQSSNWGGSFIGVPEAAEHKEEAVKLAAWLTAPEQQATLFTERGSFPSSAEAQQMPAVQEATHEYFDNAPIGEVFSGAAAEIPSTVIGPRDQTLQEALTDGLVQIEQQGESPEDAWDNTVADIENSLQD